MTGMGPVTSPPRTAIQPLGIPEYIHMKTTIVSLALLFTVPAFAASPEMDAAKAEVKAAQEKVKALRATEKQAKTAERIEKAKARVQKAQDALTKAEGQAVATKQ